MKDLFFSPHSGIWVHAFPEALVAEALQVKGHEVVYVTCGRVLQKHCVVMSAVRVGVQATSAQKERICKHCEASKRLIRREFAFPGYDLSENITDDERLICRKAAENLDRKNYLESEAEGIPIARFALYEFLLDRKKSSLEFDEKEWAEYLVYFENAMLSFFGSRRILEKESPDRVVVYNALYSVNRVMCELAELRGIPTYFLHAGLNLSNRLQTLLVGRRNPFFYYEEMIKAWPQFRNKPCAPDIMKGITDHFMVLFRGHSPFGYSAAANVRMKSIREGFGVKSHQRVLVATMSSYDERFAAETVRATLAETRLLFPQQVDWIKAVLEYVSGRDDLFLIVRIHPREFPNKREKVKSEHALMLEEVLEHQLPGNAAVNWPADDISLYDMAKETSVFLNAWSAVGKEMSLLGIPVVLYAPSLAAYPADLNYSATTREGYFEAIERALLEGWSAERSRMTYRWLAVEYGYGLVHIDDAFPSVELVNRALWRRVAHRIFRKLVWLHFERHDCRRRPKRLAAAPEIAEIVEDLLPTPCSLRSPRIAREEVSLQEETSGLHTELRRIGKAILTHTASSDTQLLGIKFEEFLNKGEGNEH